eukprot:g19904.t1
MDIQSLYTCIPLADGLKALRFFLSRRPDQSPSTDTLIRPTELVLTLNNFSHSLQTKEVAMGTHTGPSYACLFAGYVEQSPFRSYSGPSPHLFLCYINDCIGAASCSHEEFEQFINFTNTFHPNLKFTWTISDTSFSFLDLSVSISGDHFKTDICFKPTNSHNYLDYTSSHSPSCQNVIPYSQFLCLCRVCSQDGVYHSRISQMSPYFKDCNSPSTVVENALNRISCISCTYALRSTPHNKNRNEIWKQVALLTKTAG